MFDIVVQPTALKQLRRLRRVDAVAILDGLGRYLRQEPDRPNRTRISGFVATRIRPIACVSVSIAFSTTSTRAW